MAYSELQIYVEFSQAAMIGQGARPGFPDQAVDKQIPILCLAT